MWQIISENLETCPAGILGLCWVQTLESGLSFGIFNRKSGLQGPDLPDSQEMGDIICHFGEPYENTMHKKNKL